MKFEFSKFAMQRLAAIRLPDLKRLAAANGIALRRTPHVTGLGLVLLMMATILVTQDLRAPFHPDRVATRQGVTLAPRAASNAAEKTKAAQRKKDAAIFEKESRMSHYDLLHRWDAKIAAAAKRFAVPEDWIRAVMIQESGGRTMLSPTRRWISNKGAMGLMQLMPETYRELRAAYGFGADPFDVDDNINAGAAYLKWLHGKYGMSGMFVAYNAGPLRFEQNLADKSPLPLETQLYVKGIARSLGFEENALLPPSMRSASAEIVAVAVPESLPPVVDAAINVSDIKVEPEFSSYDRPDLYAPCAFRSGMGCASP